MKETPQQYRERILGYVEGKQPLVVQAATPRSSITSSRVYPLPNCAGVPLRRNGR